MSDDDKQNIIDGEVVAEGDSSTSADDFLNLESLVKNYFAKVAASEKELHEKSQILNDAFENDAVYWEHAEKAKEANKIKSATKQQILKQPAMAELAERIKDMKFDIQENRTMLSDYLQQYQKETGATQIEVEDGEILEIVSTVKLVKRSSSQR